MNARFVSRAVILLAVAAVGFAFGILAREQTAFSQDRSVESNVVPLIQSDFETPEAPIRNYFYALRNGDMNLANRCFAQDDALPVSADHMEKVFPPLTSLSGVKFTSRRQVSEDVIEIRAMAVGDEWNQQLSDVYTVQKTGDRWAISDFRMYGPDEGGAGRFDAANAPDPDVDPLVGIWLNENSDRPDITRIEVSIENNELVTRVWGSCSPFDCYWGKARATVSAENPSRLSVTYVKTFSNAHISLSLEQDRLSCSYVTVFKDGSGRTGREIVESFKRL